jgi:hypothetical protein
MMQDILYTPQTEDHLNYMENVLNQQEAYGEVELGEVYYSIKEELEEFDND